MEVSWKHSPSEVIAVVSNGREDDAFDYMESVLGKSSDQFHPLCTPESMVDSGQMSITKLMQGIKINPHMKIYLIIGETDPILWIYTISIVLSVVLQLPLRQCTLLFGIIDICGACNTFTTIAGSIYASTKFGTQNKRSGASAFVAAAISKAFSVMLMPSHCELPSLLITLGVYAMNVTVHAFDVLGI
jgi:hypothetical protein